MNNIFIILLNLYLLISIPIYWIPYRWSVLQNSYFTFGIFTLFIISNFMLKKKREFKNIWLGIFTLISLLSIFLHNYYISDFTKKFSSFSLMSEGFIYVLCGGLFLKLVYEYCSRRLRDYPMFWIVLLIWIIRAILEKSVTPIVSLTIFTTIYLFKKKQYTLAYFMFLPITVGVLKFWYYMWEKFQSRLWTNVVLIKDILKNPLGTGFDNSLNGNVIFCNMSTAWGKIFNALDNTGRGDYIYPHNDYLNIAKNLGLPALICVIFGLITLFKNARFEPLTYLCLAILLMAGFQTTFYEPVDGIMFIPLFAILGVRKNVS